MVSCKNIKHYTGTKTEIIRQMINDKKREEVTNNLLKLKKNKDIKELTEQIRVQEDKKNEKIKLYENKINRLEKRLLKFGLSYSKWTHKLEVPYRCHVPKKTLDKLERADHLFSLGKRSEAKIMWDEIIKEYDLLKE